MRQRRFGHALLLAILLVFIQQVMATHPLSHVKAETAKHLSSYGGEEQDCPECLVLGGLGFSAPVQAAEFSAHQGVDRIVLPDVVWQIQPRSAAHAIRAPPFSV